MGGEDVSLHVVAQRPHPAGLELGDAEVATDVVVLGVAEHRRAQEAEDPAARDGAGHAAAPMTTIAKTSDATDASRIILSMASPIQCPRVTATTRNARDRGTHCPFRSGTLDPAVRARKVRPVKVAPYRPGGSRAVTESHQSSCACAAAIASAAIGGGAWKSQALNSTAFGTPI